MIGVSLRERMRKFDVFIGNKKVGHVETFQGSGRASAYGETIEGREHYLKTHKTLKQATDAILCWEGFGKSINVRVVRARGGRKG